MTFQKPARKEYLDKDFDYTKLTKQELRAIMSEFGVEEIPPLTSLKSTIMDAYKKNVHDKIGKVSQTFSTENVFQSQQGERQQGERQQSEHQQGESMDTPRDETSPSSSFIFEEKPGSYINRSFASDGGNHRESRGDSTFFKKSTIEESSEINSTAFDRKSKLPFIAISKRKNGEPVKREIEPPVHAKTFRGRKLGIFASKGILLTGFLALCVYFKYFCPYCRLGLEFCIPIPPHSKLINNELVCDQGYVLSKGIANICVPDMAGKSVILQKTEQYVRMLEYLKGDYKFGFSKSPKMKISVISDREVLKNLMESPRIIISGDWIEAKSVRVSARTFVRHYAVILFRGLIVIVIVLIILKILFARRRKTAMLRSRATAVSKEILEILNRQIMMSVRSTQFKPYVQAQQIKDALDIKDDIWGYINEIVEKNSNVEKIKDDQGRCVWKWIGPVLYKTESVDFE